MFLKEERRIIFSSNEISAAMRRHCGLEQVDFPHEEIGQVIISNREVTFLFKGATAGDETEKSFDYDFVESALVGYCVEHDVIMPIGGEKSLIPETDELVLMVKIRARKE